MIDIEIGALIESVVCRLRGGRRKVIMNIREPGIPISNNVQTFKFI